MAAACPNCDNTGWVCEAHRDRPWGGISRAANACECGPGEPCPVCNRGPELKPPPFDELNAITARRAGGEPDDEAEHFYRCGCGEAVDMRRLGDVLHHEQPGHRPLRIPS